MQNYFEGHYYKHQKGDRTLCVIAGRTESERFIQIITNDFSKKVPYTEGNTFSEKGLRLNISEPGITLVGQIRYGRLHPIKYDIMGPFQFFPMECSHGIVSMYHRLEGQVELNGERIDFTGGKGYIEMDSGRSFPSSYTWIQANDFSKPYSIMAAVAEIPFCGMHFRGCICVIWYRGREYRFATYLGVKVRVCRPGRIVLTQGKYRLDIKIRAEKGYSLSAPQNGEMTRMIIENPSCMAEFIFYAGKKRLFHLCSRQAGYEYERKISRNLQ